MYFGSFFIRQSLQGTNYVFFLQYNLKKNVLSNMIADLCSWQVTPLQLNDT